MRVLEQILSVHSWDATPKTGVFKAKSSRGSDALALPRRGPAFAHNVNLGRAEELKE
jgi:hypothetical protein